MSETLQSSLEQPILERPVQPEFWSLSQQDWQYFFTIHPLEGRPLAWKESDRGEWERRKFIRKFINFLQAKLRIKKRDYFWVATVEEEGKGGIPHLHFLFRLKEEGFEKGAKQIPSPILVRETFQFCVGMMEKEFGPLDARIDDIGDTEGDRSRVTSYLCKMDGQREEKEFILPTPPKQKGVKEVNDPRAKKNS